MVRGSNNLINIIQKVSDLVILITLTLAAGDRLIPEELSRVLAVYCSFLMIVVFPIFHLYQSWRKTSLMNQIRVLALAWFMVLVLFNFIIILLSSPEQLAVLSPMGLFASSGFNYWALLIFGCLSIARGSGHIAMRFARSRGYNQQVAVIIGAGETGQKLAQYLSANQWLGIVLEGFFDDKVPMGTSLRIGSETSKTVIGPTDACHDLIKEKKVDLVFLALPMHAEKKITEIVSRLGTSGHAVLMVQDLFSFGIQKARSQHFGELQLLDFYLFPIWKRVFDIVFSLLVVILTFPAWLIIMLAIKAEDRGPVLFRHPRVMEGGKRFDCLKFRSMHLNAQDRLERLLDQDPALRRQWRQSYKLQNDPRVTKVGRFLRRFSMDELPQFINVLSGQMSVVGARPVVPEELDLYYREATLTYCAMKPGITGLWQVSKQGEVADYAQRVALDRRYILNCSFWLDLKIIAKTGWRILFDQRTC